tara:strand:- start:8 stop:799 length:792 start_codon:yes stop_codon:yes gene_type:complete
MKDTFVDSTTNKISAFSNALFTLANAIFSNLDKKQVEVLDKLTTKVYADPSAMGTSNQQKHRENAEVALIQDNGIDNAWTVVVWLLHPTLRKGTYDALMASIIKLSIALILHENKIPYKHAKGKLTKEFRAIATSLGFKCSDSKIVVDDAVKLLAKQHRETLEVIRKSVPISKGAEEQLDDHGDDPKPTKVKYQCSVDCKENKKFAKWHYIDIDGNEPNLKSYAVCAECNKEVKPVYSHEFKQIQKLIELKDKQETEKELIKA